MDWVQESGPAGGIHHEEYVPPFPPPGTDVHCPTKVVPTLRTRLSQRPKYNGSPTLIFLAGAALRVADVTRILKDKRLRGEKGGEIAKLFARHFKLEEHVAYLRRTKIAAAVGTPGRIGKLLCETGARARIRP